MPALLEAVESAPVSVRDLSNMERTVALYASEMPTAYRYRRGDDEKLCGWILQGAERLGLEELYRSAACASGYMRLWVEDEARPRHTAAHVARFPVQKRFDLAQRTASMVTIGHVTEVSAAALERSDRPIYEVAPLMAVAA
ncbi:hypothetical protein [Streptomyces sp. WM6372]|uniref:hypothetical protein n=1 Tax=Streptomyces sp. WM6372 TaxID=1415555 RepID=UPI0006AEBD54|nr:hypothetical protein [Streptomyces sp. WM6372]